MSLRNMGERKAAFADLLDSQEARIVAVRAKLPPATIVPNKAAAAYRRPADFIEDRSPSMKARLSRFVTGHRKGRKP